MGKSESDMRQKVHKAIRKLDPVAIENDVYRGGKAGYPDTNFIGGEIELKRVADYPKRATTKVRLPHFTPQQKVFLFKRWYLGGACWLLLRIDSTNDWFLFTGQAAKSVGNLNRQELMDNSYAYWENGLDYSVFCAILQIGRGK